jgi:hypothetical protein
MLLGATRLLFYGGILNVYCIVGIATLVRLEKALTGASLRAPPVDRHGALSAQSSVAARTQYLAELKTVFVVASQLAASGFIIHAAGR